MDRQPILDGERLWLRPLRKSDWAAMYGIAADPQVWALHPMQDRWQEPVFRAFFDEALASCGALAIIDKASGAIIGSSRFDGYDPVGQGQVEIGWTFLARPYWGLGYNAEAKRLMLAHALPHVGRAIFRVGADNVISRRAMGNIGGRLTPEISVVEKAGRQIEHVVYEITSESFANGPLAQ